MNKGRKRSPFNAPSQKAEKYLETLSRAKPEGTYIPSETNVGEVRTTSTDEPLDNVVVPSTLKASEMPKWLSAILIAIPVILPIAWFFWNMNASMDYTKTNMVHIQEKVDSIEKNIWSLSKETNEKQNEIKLYLERVLERLDGLVNSLSVSKPVEVIPSTNNNSLQSQTQETTK